MDLKGCSVTRNIITLAENLSLYLCWAVCKCLYLEIQEGSNGSGFLEHYTHVHKLTQTYTCINIIKNKIF